MSNDLKRRGFLGLAAMGGGALAAGLVPLRAAEDGKATASPVHAEFPSHDPDVVREVVGASHGRIDDVRTLVEATPALAKSAWDWGFGDWESALGAASHMGRRDIAELLMQHGARPDLFTHAMLGHLDVVRAAVAAHPGIQRIHGPHGITLMSHARSGGEPAAEVVAYLDSVGGADVRSTSLEIGEDEKKRYLGRFVFGTGDDDHFEVLINSRGSLAIRRGERFGRVLNRVEDHGFAPGGAPDVRVRFVLREDQVVGLTIHDPDPLVTAKRVRG
jgi:hypothetical protein